MPHKRIDIAQDDIALRCLSGCRYKVLHALVNRADGRGICFPGDEYLAQATGYTRRSVQRSLAALAEALVIQYHRKDEWDNFTRRQLPNVMQVNPDYISLAAEFEAEARELWDALIERCGNDSVRLWSRTITNTKEPTPEPAPGVQFQIPNTKNHQRSLNGTGQKPKAKSGSGATGHNDLTNQREAPISKSSVPPDDAQYANPESINVNLPNHDHEALAADIRQFGISMPLARGFVVTYGYDRTKLAFDAVKKMGGKAREPAAVFRSIVQIRLAEEFALAQQKMFNIRKQ